MQMGYVPEAEDEPAHWLFPEIRLLLVRRHSWILVTVQFFFVGGATRHYLLAYQSAGHNRKGGYWCRSLADVYDPRELDLRRREHAEALEAELLELDLTDIERGE
jgi:hypothetical protein